MLFSAIFGSRYSKMDQTKFFKSCLPQILLGPFLNTLIHLYLIRPNMEFFETVELVEFFMQFVISRIPKMKCLVGHTKVQKKSLFIKIRQNV